MARSSSKNKVFRANLDDVENLSYGKGAKKQRGTGSRSTCHRLNRDERRLYDLAKRNGYLTVKGTGYRKERKGSPVCNTFRQRCDALEEICIVIEKRSDYDTVVIDFSTLRVMDDTQYVSLLLENVFKLKYPEFYDLIIKDYYDDDENDDKGKDYATYPITAATTTNTTTNTVGIIHNTTRRPINWEAVKTKPIWGVNERLLTVTCERDVAKSLAMNVLNESSANFDGIQVQVRVQVDAEKAAIGTEIITVEAETTTKNDQEEATIIKNPVVNDNDDDCIDWDDI